MQRDRPFQVRCSRVACPGFNLSQGYSDPEVALDEWNRRVQIPPATLQRAADVCGFSKKSLIRGEMVWMTLDKTGVLTSDAIAFSPNSAPLMPRHEAK